MIKISILENSSVTHWWKNFDDYYYDPLYRLAVPDKKQSTEAWNKFINGMYKGILVHHWENYTIEFFKDEDYINFILKWS